MTLIDEFLPEYSAVERHEVVVRARAEVVYGAIRSADLGGALPIRALLLLRAVPAMLARGGDARARLRRHAGGPITLADFERRGFAILAEDPPREILIGLVGAFWTPGGELRPTGAAHFRGPQESGTARAAWAHARLKGLAGARQQVPDPASRPKQRHRPLSQRDRWYAWPGRSQ